MFGRKPPSGPADAPRPGAGVTPTPIQPAAPRPVAPAVEARPTPPTPPRAVQPAAETEADLGAPPPRPTPVPPRPEAVRTEPARRPVEPVRAEPMPAHEVRKLTVGRGIAFSGEISACDHLIVEGNVEAKLPEGQRVEITETGLFRGTVVCTEADIGGRFEGEITVRGRMTVRASGRIEGKIQYGELAVEAGGALEGEIRGISSGAAGGKQGRPVKLSPAPLLGETGDAPDRESRVDATGESA